LSSAGTRYRSTATFVDALRAIERVTTGPRVALIGTAVMIESVVPTNRYQRFIHRTGTPVTV
jgi:hypothetical protein